jgi:hypothetical protein
MIGIMSVNCRTVAACFRNHVNKFYRSYNKQNIYFLHVAGWLLILSGVHEASVVYLMYQASTNTSDCFRTEM